MASVVEEIRTFMTENLGCDDDIDPEIDLLEAQVLDSFNIVEIAMFIQENFGIELDAEDITRENFARLSGMVSLVEKYKATEEA